MTHDVNIAKHSKQAHLIYLMFFKVWVILLNVSISSVRCTYHFFVSRTDTSTPTGGYLTSCQIYSAIIVLLSTLIVLTNNINFVEAKLYGNARIVI
jgi:uncharacterized membrane protein